jgi:hypothetical protein
MTDDADGRPTFGASKLDSGSSGKLRTASKTQKHPLVSLLPSLCLIALSQPNAWVIPLAPANGVLVPISSVLLFGAL